DAPGPLATLLPGFWLGSTAGMLALRAVASLAQWLQPRDTAQRRILIVGTNAEARRFARERDAANQLVLGFCDDRNRRDLDDLRCVTDLKNFADYLVDHSTFIYVMDPDGQYLHHFSYGTPPEQMASELRAYL
ncbi:MAG: hypothetical protein AAF637_15515, partial [Pseudomonadota bacterium]